MARNGSGVYSLYTPGNPVVAGTTIDPVAQNNTLNDLATAMTNSAARNGEGVPTANWPMAGFKLTGLGNGTSAGDSLAYGQALGAVSATGVAVGGALTTATTGNFSGLVTASSGVTFDGVSTLGSYVSTGTFTPTVTFGGAAVGLTYSIQVGQYTRIGDRVFFELEVRLSALGSSTGTFSVNGLPLALVGGFNPTFACWAANMTGLTGTPIANSAGTTSAQLQQTTATGLSAALTQTVFTSTSFISMSGHYRCA